MLYRLARRYDEFPGELDAGSSLRGAFKGWFHHGVALEREWATLDMEREPDLDDQENLLAWRDRPLGAFYRVNPYRLDDVQSAITELYAIAASAAIHDGWKRPAIVKKGRRTLHVIQRPVTARGLGGHAFAVVGYNEVGFLVQNSWGPDWGKDGFATLPYDDWFDSVYDAWVARPGVPQTPFYRGRTRTSVATGGELATGAGPDLRRLAMHVVNLGNEGRLSSAGKFASTPRQIDRLAEHMDAWHDFWLARGRATQRNVVLYAHGGGVTESSGLEIGQRQLNWWLNNGVYPVSFVWETGAGKTLLNAIVDAVKEALPIGGVGFDLMEQFDRLVEGVCRNSVRFLWEEMKQNGRAASLPIPNPGAIQWPPASSAASDAMAEMPGASLLVDRLAQAAARPGKPPLVVHLVAHSAGSVLQGSLLERLNAAGLPVGTMNWMAPAITVREFADTVLPHLGGPSPTVRRFTSFNLSDPLELDDSLGFGGFDVYHKSIVYLLARAFERVTGGPPEAPILGMTKFWDDPFGGSTLGQVVAAAGGSLVVSRSSAPVDGRSDATRHASFDEDTATLTSIAMRILGVTTEPEKYTYESHAALRDEGTPALPAGVPVAGPAGVMEPAPTPVATPTPVPAGPSRAGGAVLPMGAPPPDRRATRATRAPRTRREPARAAAGTAAPGSEPIVETEQAPSKRPTAPRTANQVLEPEVAVAPQTSSPILDVLQATGWKVPTEPTDG
jgi:hypothetical protein